MALITLRLAIYLCASSLLLHCVSSQQDLLDIPVKAIIDTVATVASLTCKFDVNTDSPETIAYDYKKCGIPQCLHNIFYSKTFTISYTLYTQDDISRGYDMKFEDESNLDTLPLDKKGRIILYLPGFTQTKMKPLPQKFKDDTLRACRNVTYFVIVDYGNITNNYVDLTSKADDIAGRLAIAITALIDYGYSPEQIVVIGYSISGPIATFINPHLIVEYQLSTVFCIDPAGFFLDQQDISCRINKDRAKNVISFHTSCILGSIKRDSTVDYTFYCDCGQPETGVIQIEKELNDHTRFYSYYEALVNGSSIFKFYKCPPGDDCVSSKCTPVDIKLGDRRIAGQYYVTVEKNDGHNLPDLPFC